METSKSAYAYATFFPSSVSDPRCEFANPHLGRSCMLRRRVSQMRDPCHRSSAANQPESPRSHGHLNHSSAVSRGTLQLDLYELYGLSAHLLPLLSSLTLGSGPIELQG